MRPVQRLLFAVSVAFALVTCAGKITAAAPIIDQNVVVLPTHITFGGGFGPGVPAWGTVITNQYPGVTFGPTFGYDPCPNCGSLFQTLGHLNNGPLNTAGGADIQPGSILFSSDVTAAAFSWITNPGSTTFSALLDGVLVETFTGNRPSYDIPNTGHYFGFTGIRFDEIRMVITSSDNTAFVLDNLKYQIAPAVDPVPLPAALPLFATILAGGGLIAWRRKRKAAKVVVA